MFFIVDRFLVIGNLGQWSVKIAGVSGLEQLVARERHTLKVRGSSPLPATSHSRESV